MKIEGHKHVLNALHLIARAADLRSGKSAAFDKVYNKISSKHSTLFIKHKSTKPTIRTKTMLKGPI